MGDRTVRRLRWAGVGEGVITLAVFALFASLAAGAFIVMRMRGDNEQWRLGALVCLGSVILLAFLVEAIWEICRARLTSPR